MLSAIFRRWRSLRLRSRAAAVLLAAMAVLVGAQMALRWWHDTWPARVVLRTSMGAGPLGFSPDGRTFLTNGHDGITSWDVASGREGWTSPHQGREQAHMGAFSPDGRTFAAANFGITNYAPDVLSIHLHDVATGRVKATLRTPHKTIMHLAFAADGRTLRAWLGDDPQTKDCLGWNPSFGSDLNEVATWDASTGLPVSSRPLTAPTRGAVTAVSPDGRMMAIADRKNAVRLWDLDADGPLGQLPGPATAGLVDVAGLGFSDDGRTLAVGRMSGMIELWDVAGLRLRKTLRAHPDNFRLTTIRLAPDGRTLALVGFRWRDDSPIGQIFGKIRGALRLESRVDWEMLLLDLADGRPMARAADSMWPSYSPDGRTLAADEPDGSTRLRTIPGP